MLSGHSETKGHGTLSLSNYSPKKTQGGAMSPHMSEYQGLGQTWAKDEGSSLGTFPSGMQPLYCKGHDCAYRVCVHKFGCRLF